jgi:hypothetical protein
VQYDLINLDYNHQDIMKSIDIIEKYLDVLQEIVEKLVFSDKTIPKPTEEPKKPTGSKVKIVRINK